MPLLSFISRLLEGQRRLDDQSPLLASLVLARGLLLRQEAARKGRHLNHQTLVLGPTQAGKSTLVNLLLGGEHAEASPLAGFTRHAQGFGAALSPEQDGLLQALLPGFRRVERSALKAEDYGCYSLSEMQRAGILWDTPDFDSVNARDYGLSLPAFCALADQLILVVSKEKYADQSVWTMLRLLLAANIPLALVVNKVPPNEAQQLEAIITRRFASENLPCPPIFSLPWLNQSESGQLAATAQGQRLLEWHRRSGQISLTPTGLGQFLREHWPAWTKALRTELAQQSAWQAHIQVLNEELGQHFSRDYLQDQTYAETRARVLAEFLRLLELPGFGAFMGQVRGVLTWPVRTFMGLGANAQPAQDASQTRDPRSEASILAHGVEQLLQKLLAHCLTETGQHQGRERDWWQQLWMQLAQAEQALKAEANRRIEEHQTEFQQQIRATADELLSHLKEDPVRLNGLRVARVTTDAGAVAIAFATGTTGWMDLALTPPMLALSSFLTESALGQYLNNQLELLKEKQLASVELRLLAPLQEALEALTLQLDQQHSLGLGAAELAQGELALEGLA